MTSLLARRYIACQGASSPSTFSRTAQQLQLQYARRWNVTTASSKGPFTSLRKIHPASRMTTRSTVTVSTTRTESKLNTAIQPGQPLVPAPGLLAGRRPPGRRPLTTRRYRRLPCVHSSWATERISTQVSSASASASTPTRSPSAIASIRTVGRRWRASISASSRRAWAEARAPAPRRSSPPPHAPGEVVSGL